MGLIYFPDLDFLVASPILYGLPVMYLGTVMLLSRYMRNQKAWDLSRVMQIYNIVQIILCAYMVQGLFQFPNVFAINTERSARVEWFVLVHYLSKYLDWCDTIFMCLRKKEDQISFLQIYHHATISIVWGYVLSIGWGSGTVSYGAMINSVTHVLMYTHYCAAAVGLRNPFKRYLTMFQISQFWSCQLHAWIVAFGTYQTFFPSWHETVYPQHLASIQVAYHVTMIYLFTFRLRWAPAWITGRVSIANASSLKAFKTSNRHKGITVEELAAHNKHDDAWLAIHGKVYDVSEWAKTHPGGDIILLGGRTNAAVMFEMYHPRDVSSAILEKYCVGEMKEGSFESYYDWESDVFYKTLKTRVVDALNSAGIKNWHDSPTMYLKTIFILSGFVTSLMMVWGGSFLGAAFLGLFSSCVGTCIMHDGCHGAYSRHTWINRLAAWGMDMIGASTFVWEFHHNTGHHAFTNLVSTDRGGQENDPDVFSSYPLMRMTPFDELKPHHRFQWLYATPVFAGFTMMKVLYSDLVALSCWKITDFISMDTRMSDLKCCARVVFMKSFSLCYMLGIPIYKNGFVKGVALFATAHAVCGLILAVMFIVTHISADCEFLEKDCDGNSHNNENNWAAIQCRTSTNWGTKSIFWTHFSGGLNHQIEHHLFPSICHVYYPIIQPVVEETCNEFGVPYHSHSSLFTAYYRTLHHLHLLGTREKREISKKSLRRSGRSKSISVRRVKFNRGRVSDEEKLLIEKEMERIRIEKERIVIGSKRSMMPGKVL